MSIKTYINSHLYQVFIEILVLVTLGIVGFQVYSQHGKTQLNTLIQSIYDRNPNIKLMKDYGNKKDKYGRSLIFVAFYTKDLFTYDVFAIYHNVNLNVKDEFGVPLICTVLKSPKLEYLENLLGSKKEIDFTITDKDGYNVLMTCVVMNKYKHFELIVNHLKKTKNELFIYGLFYRNQNREGKTAANLTEEYKLEKFSKLIKGEN